MIEYNILDATSTRDLTLGCEAALKYGWVLQGGVSVTWQPEHHDHYRGKLGGYHYHQAMTRDEAGRERRDAVEANENYYN